MSSTGQSLTDNTLISSDIDIAIGARLRFRRQILGWSQGELADRCGVSPQQIHKYETGASAIRPHRLLKFSLALDVPISWFFKGLESNTTMPADLVSILANPQISELVRGFQAIDDCDVRNGLLDMIRTINRLKRPEAPELADEKESA